MRKRGWASAFAFLGVAFAGACGDSHERTTGLDEPIRFGYKLDNVSFRSEFFSGEMPVGQGPAVAGVDLESNETVQGERNKSGVGIRIRSPGFTVATRLKGHGTGYWISRVNVAEVFAAGELRAELFFDVAADLAPGMYQVEIAGVDAKRQFGEHTTFPLDVKPLTPSGAAVLSLRWDAPVDLDLQLRAPDGTFLDPKNPTTAPSGALDGGNDLSLYGRRDRDSIAACIDDGIRQEDIVFGVRPPSGHYVVYVNLFDACRHVGTNYEISIAVEGAPLQRFYGRIGEAEARRGGFSLGDFVTDVTF